MSNGTGGHAYPTTRDTRYGVDHEEGMTLRDWFAGQFLANMSDYYTVREPILGADAAYTWADAMLRARGPVE